MRLSLRFSVLPRYGTVIIVGLLAVIVFPGLVARAGSIQPLPPVADTDGRLGLCDVAPGAAPGVAGVPWAQLAYNAGARINRWEFRWDRIEAQPGTWDFSKDDPAVLSSRQSGLDVEGILIGTPGWSVVKGRQPGNGLPRGLNRPISDPTNLWATYVRQTVTHYAGQVKYWEVWNEPDLPFFWSGSPEEYEKMLQVTYQVVHSADPAASVVLAGMVLPDLRFVSRVLDLAARAAHHVPVFDIAAWHAYGPAPALYTNLQRFRSLLGVHGFARTPLWVTEAGFPASNPNGEPRQAAYVFQTILYALAAGSDKVLVYRASDDPTPKTWGLASAAGDIRMGYVAYQVAARYLAHAEAIIYAPTARTERFVVYRPDSRVIVAWSRGTSDVKVAVPSGHPTVTVVNWQGATTAVAGGAGNLHLTLPGATYNLDVDPKSNVVGGPPMLAVEDNSALPAGQPLAYLPGLSGAGRRLVALNTGDTPGAIQVNALDYPHERSVVQLPAQSVRSIDLDLLAGTGYRSAYSISSVGDIQSVAASDRGTIGSIDPSATWILLHAPESLSLTTASASEVSVDVTGYAKNGQIRLHEVVQVRRGHGITWTLGRVLVNSGLTLVMHASDAILVTGPTASDPLVASARTSWYAVRPRARMLFFNPGDSAVHLDVRFAGAPTVKGEQLRLAPHHSYALSTHGAQGFVANATAPVAMSYLKAGDPTVNGEPSTRLGFPVAGRKTRVALFNPNPTSGPAHVTLTVVRARGSTTSTEVVDPSHVATVVVRRSGTSVTGVILRSDVPVVASPLR